MSFDCTLLIHLAIFCFVPKSWGANDAPSETVVVSDEADQNAKATSTSAALTVIALDETLPISGDIADALETTTGVRIQRLGGMAGWSTVSIRGSSSRQVAMYLDGIPLNPDGASALNLSEIPTTAFERIEVYRSNPPPQFGAAPMGGAVNLVTPKSPKQFGVSATVGDHATHRGGGYTAASTQLKAATVDAWGVAESVGTDGDFTFFQNRATVYNLFDDSFDERRNNDKQQLNLLGRVRVASDRGTATFLQTLLNRDEGVPGPANAQSIGTRLNTTRTMSAVRLETDGSWGRSALMGWWIDTGELWDDRGDEVGVGAQWEDRDTRMLGLQTSTEAVLTSRLVGILSGAFRADQYNRYDRLVDARDDPMSRSVWSVSPALQGQLAQEALQVDGTLFVQGIHNEVFADTQLSDVPGTLSSTNTHLVSAKPRGGILLRFGRATVAKASWGQYLRPPDFTELFGNRGSVIGNPSLLPESSTTADAGIRSTKTVGSLDAVAELSVFHTASQNKIVFVQNSQRTVRPINVKGARVYGIETALTLSAFDLLGSQTSVTRTWSTNQSQAKAYSGNQLPGVPSIEIWQQSSIGWSNRVTAGHTYSFTAGEFWDQTNWYQAAPRHLHAAFLRMVPVRSGPEIEVEARNLTNQLVEQVDRDPLNPEDNAVVLKGIDDFHGYPLPGRTWLVSLRWSA